MPCLTQTNLNPVVRKLRYQAIDRLRDMLAKGTVKVVIGPSGAIAFAGWNQREGVSDICAYRKLTADNSPELRRAVMRAEALAGRKLDAKAIGAGMHSHDGGRTWSTH